MRTKPKPSAEGHAFLLLDTTDMNGMGKIISSTYKCSYKYKLVKQNTLQQELTQSNDVKPTILLAWKMAYYNGVDYRFRYRHTTDARELVCF